MSKLVFTKPDPEAPGYLRRMRQALEFQEAFKSANPGPAAVDKLIEFLLPNVTEPVDRNEAREALLDASQAQFMELLGALTGGDENPTP